jgi:hypothetical protein
MLSPFRTSGFKESTDYTDCTDFFVGGIAGVGRSTGDLTTENTESTEIRAQQLISPEGHFHDGVNGHSTGASRRCPSTKSFRAFRVFRGQNTCS